MPAITVDDLTVLPSDSLAPAWVTSPGRYGR